MGRGVGRKRNIKLLLITNYIHKRENVRSLRSWHRPMLVMYKKVSWVIREAVLRCYLCFRFMFQVGPVDEAILYCSLNKPDPLDQEWTQASRLQNRRKVPSVAQSALSCLSLVTIIFREEKFLNFLSAIFSFSYKKVFIFPNHCFKVSRGVRFASACFERKFRVSKCTNFRTRF